MGFDVEPLKEPRGFLRLMQWFLAMIAFATCCDFSVKFGFQVNCKEETNITSTLFITEATYPFSVDENHATEYETPVCSPPAGNKKEKFTFPGDFSSDAEFFVFVGVITWLYCAATLALYVFYSYLYNDEQKSYPKIDLIIAIVLAFTWLVASSAWANGLNGLKSTADVQSWIYNADESDGIKGPCAKQNGNFISTNVENCSSTGDSGFGKGNASVCLGFLNCFLWICSTWFIYKETSWFRARQQAQQAQPGFQSEI